MTGVFDGLRVLDLSWGIAGPMATMLLSDQGAEVTRVERPEGNPFQNFSGDKVWSRGKRSAVLDLKTAEDLDVFKKLASVADVVVESFSPGVMKRLGISYEDLRPINPRLIYCSLTGYGDDGTDAERPAYDALVAARTGQFWEHRGRVGGTISLISGGPGMMQGLEPPTQECWVGPPRKGPLFSGVPWASVATAYHASIAIAAALRVRERTGVGQRVQTSLVQGVLGNTFGVWQRAEKHDAPWFQSWVIDPRAPKALWKSSDDKWMHQWNALPSFVLGTAEKAKAEADGTADQEGWEVTAPKEASMRIGIDPQDMIILQHYDAELKEAIGSLTSDFWLQAGADAGVPIQVVRSPEDALRDASFLADGCVIEVDDPELGKIRQVGSVIRLSQCETEVPGPAPTFGQHTVEVRDEAALIDLPEAIDSADSIGGGDAPLAGIKVLDLGLAVAGPFGTQLLADLGAEVIKVNTAVDGYWFASHLAIGCNRGKKSIAMNIKTPEGREALYRLIESADIVQHNMRYDAAKRLGVDYDSLKAIKPDLIYCHTRGFEHGDRDSLPGNDQTGAALAGTEWLDGATDNGGRPLWSLCSAGDTGNGYLSAIGMVEALYHRDRTGEGQFVDTSIVYAHLLNASMTWTTLDESATADRPSMDEQHYGWDALYGLYETNDGWLCLAVLNDTDWDALAGALGNATLADDARFGTAGDRRSNDSQLRAALATIFASDSAANWFKFLDQVGVPVEIVSDSFAFDVFDNEEFKTKGWTAQYTHDGVGRLDQLGLLFDLEQTPGTIAGPSPLVGQHTHEILTEAGYSPDQIGELLSKQIVFDVETAPRP
jgi:crotonobetainyl-CoA:carnitine CoA-transferase CaiB-like acyl-CoA transferase